MAQLDLQQLRMFHALALTKSHTRAGERLHRSQSAVSHGMRKLQESLGLALVEARPFRLTPAGRILFEACETAFAALDGAVEAMGRLQGAEGGVLRVGSTVEFGYSILMRHMGPFMEAHPELRLSFRLAHELVDRLLADELDMVVDCWEHDNPELRRDVLFREDYAVVASPDFVARRGPVTAEAMAQLPCLSLDDEGRWWHRFLVSLPAEGRPVLGRLVTINHVRAMIVAAEAGLGVALVPRYAVGAELEAGRLEALFPELPMFADRFVLYQKRCRADLDAHRRFTEYLLALDPDEFRR